MFKKTEFLLISILFVAGIKAFCREQSGEKKGKDKIQVLVDSENPSEWHGMVKVNKKFKRSGNGSFELSGQYATQIISAGMIPIDMTKTYTLTAYMRSIDKNLPASGNFGLRMYDEKKRMITIRNVCIIPNTETTVAVAAVKGAKELIIVRNAQWLSAKYGTVAFSVKNNYQDLPNFDLCPVKCVEDGKYKCRVILDKNLSRDYSVGTRVRLHIRWGAPLYTVADGWMPQDWKKFTLSIKGEAETGLEKGKFWKGTKYVRVFAWFGNWNRKPKCGARLLVDDISFSCQK